MLALSFEMGTENKICPRSSFLNDNEEMGMKHRQNVSLGRNYCSDEGEAWFVELRVCGSVHLGSKLMSTNKDSQHICKRYRLHFV